MPLLHTTRVDTTWSIFLTISSTHLGLAFSDLVISFAFALYGVTVGWQSVSLSLAHIFF